MAINNLDNKISDVLEPSSVLFMNPIDINKNQLKMYDNYDGNHRPQRVRAGPTRIWPTLNSTKIAGIQYNRVLSIINLTLYNVL
jgi:hypothetical protein